MTITLELLAIILSIVSVTVTVIGFFASLKFYRDGVELQQKANDVLTGLTEKTEAIRGQVTGMFDKTLEAAIRRETVVDASFDDVETQLEETKQSLIADVEQRIGEMGDQERQQIRHTLDERMKRVMEKLESARGSATDMVEERHVPTRKKSFAHDLHPHDKAIFTFLRSQNGKATFNEIAEHLRYKFDKVVSEISLRRVLLGMMREGVLKKQPGEQGGVVYVLRG